MLKRFSKSVLGCTFGSISFGFTRRRWSGGGFIRFFI